MLAKGVTALSAGALLGAIAWQLLSVVVRQPSTDHLGGPSIVGPLVPESGQILRSTFFDARVAALLTANDARDAQSIEQAIEELTRAPQSPARDARIRALLLRFVAMDPRRAIRFAAAISLDRPFFVSIWRAWAQVDADSARAGLADIHNANLRRAVAMDVVDLLVRTESDLKALAAVAGNGNSSGFVVDALVRVASDDPLSAFRQAIRLENTELQTQAVQRIGAEWARRDAATALSHMTEIANPLLRNRFHTAIVVEWISSDPDRAVEYIASIDGKRLLAILPEEMLAWVAEKLAIHRPEAALAAASAMARTEGRLIRQRALGRLVDRDLPWALTRLSSLPAGDERAEFAGLIAVAYARQAPANALQWLEEVDQWGVDEISARVARTLVVREIGHTDPIGAFDFAVKNGIDYFPEPKQIAELTTSEFLSFADKVVASRPPPQTVDVLMTSWSGQDAAQIWSWLVREESGHNSAIVRSVASGFAANGIALPIQSTYELPEGLRSAWITGFATAYAQAEPDAAVRWLREFENELGYEAWAVTVASALVLPQQRGNPSLPLYPRPAAQIVSTLKDPPQEIVRVVASRWAIYEPTKALEWALDRPEPEGRGVAVASGVAAWTAQNPEAAARWALSLPGGAVRDRALIAHIAQDVASHGSVSQQIINALGSNRFETAVAENLTMFRTAFKRLSGHDPSRAETLLDRHVSDAALSAAIRAEIDAGRGTPFPVSRGSILNVNP